MDVIFQHRNFFLVTPQPPLKRLLNVDSFLSLGFDKSYRNASESNLLLLDERSLVQLELLCNHRSWTEARLISGAKFACYLY